MSTQTSTRTRPSIFLRSRRRNTATPDYPALYYRHQADKAALEAAELVEDTSSTTSTLVHDTEVNFPVVYIDPPFDEDIESDPLYRHGETMEEYLNHSIGAPDCCLYHRTYKSARRGGPEHGDYGHYLREARAQKQLCLARLQGGGLKSIEYRKFEQQVERNVQYWAMWAWKEYKLTIDCQNGWRSMPSDWRWERRESDCNWRLEKEDMKIRKLLSEVEEEFKKDMGIDIWEMVEF